jgi:hypothetical protein
LWNNITGQQILIPIITIVLGWFALGIIYNLRRGNALLKWLQTGLPRVGERTTFRWLGSSVIELNILNAKPPFRRLDTIVVLSPRDVPWLWIMALFRGRRDTLILRAHLAISPRIDLELADPSSWTGRMALNEVRNRNWDGEAYQGMELMAPKGLINLARNTLEQLDEARKEFSPRYRRFSLRRDTPHLELHIPFPDHDYPDATLFFAALQRLARAINEPGKELKD